MGVCSTNRPEWTLTSLGCASQALVPVALYDTLGSDALAYILKHAEVRFSFVSKQKMPQVSGARAW